MKKHQPCGEAWVEVEASDLPLSCPGHNDALYSLHPKVYLPIEKEGKCKCYYCGTVYVLKGYQSESKS
jgi:uncharacterized Zn-finger protein